MAKAAMVPKMWSMYINEIDKLEYIMELAKIGKSRSQAAGVRALMHLYVTDEDVRNKTNAIIDDYILFNGDKPSKL